jgi:hypothetical protein
MFLPFCRGLLLSHSRIRRRISPPNVQVFLIARSYHWDISLSRDAVQGRAQILHLLAIQSAQGDLDRLLGVQLFQVAQDIRHRFPMFSFAALWNIRSID